VCTGTSKPNNFSRILLKQLLHSHANDILTTSNSLIIPSHWHTELVNSGSGVGGSSGSTINKWIVDLSERFTKLFSYFTESGQHSGSPYVYWLGGMFSAEAFVTATRQQLAQANKWNLEDMELYLELNSGSNTSGSDDLQFPLQGLTLECAVTATRTGGSTMLECSPSGSKDVMKCALSQCTLRWNCASAGSAPPEPGVGAQYMKIPVYASNTRSHRLFDVHVLVSTAIQTDTPGCHENVYLQRGVAVIAQSSL